MPDCQPFITVQPLKEVETELLVIPYRKSQLTDLAQSLDPVIGTATRDLDGAFGEARMLYPGRLPAARILMLGVGNPEELNREKAARLGNVIAKESAALKAASVAVVLTHQPAFPDAVVLGVVEGFCLGGYRFDRYKSLAKEDGGEVELTIVADEQRAADVEHLAGRAGIVASATNFARDLANMSPGELTAERLAAEAAASAERHDYGCTVLGKEEIETEGMGGLLAVNRGSIDPPSFTILEWTPEGRGDFPTLVLVGKGVVFDTGGLSLKSTKNSMDKMKFDMAGAAAVIGAIEAIARLALPIHVIALVPASDNRPGMRAYMPGEVITMHSGLTVEVLNTDAEGRMLLADALSYARRFNPDLVVDIATLTGAQVVALGTLAAAIMTSETDGDEERLALFTDAGVETGDLVAVLPMFEAYGKLLNSDVADLKNVGGREASAITAAKFLERFTDYPWVHLDIAGPAALDKGVDYRGKGATGFGVRLLVDVAAKMAGGPTSEPGN